MPPRTRREAPSKRPEQSKIPHLLPYLEESEQYESTDKDSIEHQNINETASKHRDAEIVNKLSTTSITSELPKIEDRLSRLKPSNFKCELLDYNNVKNWKTQIKQLLNLQQCWRAMETTIQMRKNGQNALIEKAMEDITWYISNLLIITHIITYVNENDQSAI